MRKLNRLLMAALVLIVPLAACDEGNDTITPQPTPPAVGQVTGSVEVSGQGIAGITVQLAGASSASTTTGSDGRYEFGGVVEGNYSVTISGIPGDYVFSNTTQTVTINQNGQVATAEFNGQFVTTASVLVNVQRGDGSGVTANVRLQGENVDQTLGTNAQGVVSFTGLRRGSYTVTLTNPPEGFNQTTQTVQLATGQAAQINFVGEREITPPEIQIERITMAGSVTAPVDPDSVANRVEVTLNVDPNGNRLSTIQLWVLQKSSGHIFKLAEQRFASTAPAAQDGDDDAEVTFAWNSDAIRVKNGSHPSILVNEGNGFGNITANGERPYHPVFINGDYEVHGVVTADEYPNQTFNAIVDVTVINRDQINLGVVANNTNWNDPVSGNPFPNTLLDGSGLRWLSGDVTITAYPIIYSQAYDPNSPVLQRAAFMMNGFVAGADVTAGGTELTSPNGPGGTFVFNFCEGATPNTGTTGTCYSSIANLNTGQVGGRSLTLQTKTQFGQFGPGLVPGGRNDIKSIEVFNEDLQSGTRATLNDVLRIDNEGPTPGAINPTFLPHPANAIVGVNGFSRTGLGAAWNLGWVKWDDALNNLVVDPANDTPVTYPAVGVPAGGWRDASGDVIRAPGATLEGIGLPNVDRPEQIYVRGPDFTTTNVAAPSASAIIANATVTKVTMTGADLPAETDSPGLTDAGSAAGTPFSDTELDYGMAARHWDLFGNRSNTNAIVLGVDGRAPIFSNAAGTAAQAVADPVNANTTKYNTYDNEVWELSTVGATYGQAVWDVPFDKPGANYTGNTTDRGNGFSGISGIVVEDWENACATGTMACAGTKMMTRYGFKLQAVAPGGNSAVLPFNFNGGPAGGLVNDLVTCGTNNNVCTTAFTAYVATQNVAATMDGYRDHKVWSWDRAGNSTTSDNVSENIADQDGPNVGNVQMPTPVTYDYTTAYTFNGEVIDNADLKKTDFSFDFNSILSLQVYSDPAGGTGNPVVDVGGNTYQENSLQLPLQNLPHTTFGSASIYLGGMLSASQPFLGCLVRADERGIPAAGSMSTSTANADMGPVEPYVHRPRGPRWRTWDHSSAYGQVNTQFNTFVPTSVPACATLATITGGLTPALGNQGAGPDAVLNTADDEFGWNFAVVGGKPTITFKGTTATFVPNIDLSQIAMYYLDTAGRAILLDPGSNNWTLIVSDTGTGSYGRSYEYTYNGTLPTAEMQLGAGAPANGTVSNYFFVLRLTGAKAGHGIIWDTTANP